MSKFPGVNIGFLADLTACKWLDVSPQKDGTDANTADIGTKALDHATFARHRLAFGVMRLADARHIVSSLIRSC